MAPSHSYARALDSSVPPSGGLAVQISPLAVGIVCAFIFLLVPAPLFWAVTRLWRRCRAPGGSELRVKFYPANLRLLVLTSEVDARLHALVPALEEEKIRSLNASSALIAGAIVRDPAAGSKTAAGADLIRKISDGWSFKCKGSDSTFEMDTFQPSSPTLSFEEAGSLTPSASAPLGSIPCLSDISLVSSLSSPALLSSPNPKDINNTTRNYDGSTSTEKLVSTTNTHIIPILASTSRPPFSATGKRVAFASPTPSVSSYAVLKDSPIKRVPLASRSFKSIVSRGSSSSITADSPRRRRGARPLSVFMSPSFASRRQETFVMVTSTSSPEIIAY